VAFVASAASFGVDFDELAGFGHFDGCCRRPEGFGGVGVEESGVGILADL